MPNAKYFSLEKAKTTDLTQAEADKEPSAGDKKLVFIQKIRRATYDLDDLLSASAEVLGRGTSGTTYKTSLPNGLVLAVKRLKNANMSSAKFRDTAEAIGSKSHSNLAALLAYYDGKDEKLLIYEFVPCRNLSSFLQGNGSPDPTMVSWDRRLKIALGAALGIEFIHSYGSDEYHGNIKPSNILLTESGDVCVSDYGFCRFFSDVQGGSQRSDVYRFGLLLVELLTKGHPDEEGLIVKDGKVILLSKWIESVARKEWPSRVLDSAPLMDEQNVEGMVQLLQLALYCAPQFPWRQPLMSEVVDRIVEIYVNLIRRISRRSCW